MKTRIFGQLFALATFALTSGCGGGDLSGHYWNITLSGLDDGCTEAPANYSEKIEYRVKIDGQDIEVAVGPDVFATGTINGCNIVYDSVVWGEDIGDVEVRWQLHGAAVINLGDGSCNPGNGTDWDGQESFEVLNSEDPAISPGCEYSIGVSGKYTGETN